MNQSFHILVDIKGKMVPDCLGETITVLKALPEADQGDRQAWYKRQWKEDSDQEKS